MSLITMYDRNGFSHTFSMVLFDLQKAKFVLKKIRFDL